MKESKKILLLVIAVLLFCMISIKSETNKIKTFSNINNSEDTLSTFLAI